MKKIALFLLSIFVCSNFTVLKTYAETTNTENPVITSRANIIDAGVGGTSGDFVYCDNGVVLYFDPNSTGLFTIYFPSDTINKFTNMAGFGTGIAGILGKTLKNPYAIGAAVVLGTNWLRIMNADNGDGVTVLINGSLTPPIQSGCNYYMMY